MTNHFPYIFGHGGRPHIGAGTWRVPLEEMPCCVFVGDDGSVRRTLMRQARQVGVQRVESSAISFGALLDVIAVRRRYLRDDPRAEVTPLIIEATTLDAAEELFAIVSSHRGVQVSAWAATADRANLPQVLATTAAIVTVDESGSLRRVEWSRTYSYSRRSLASRSAGSRA